MDVQKALELKRTEGIIGASLEARVYIFSKDAVTQKLLKEYADLLNFIFIVSRTDVIDTEPEGAIKSETLPVSVKVDKAPGAKCVRCWNYSEFVGKDSVHPALCERCAKILKGGN